MTFHITPSSNPDTRGRGNCFTVGTPVEMDTRGGAATTVMFDEYDITPAITLHMSGIVRVVAIEDTDEGCYLRLSNAGSEVTILLNGKSVRSLLNSIALYEDRDRDA